MRALYSDPLRRYVVYSLKLKGSHARATTTVRDNLWPGPNRMDSHSSVMFQNATRP